MARKPNTVVVLHPVNSAIVTLDLCIQLGSPLAPVWQKSMARDQDEMASKTIERLQILLAQQKGNKSSKRTTREEILKNCETIEVLGVENEERQVEKEQDTASEAKTSTPSRIELRSLDTSVPNKIFWKLARLLQIGSMTLEVKYNVPTITSVVPPSALYVGVPAVCSGITALFTSEVDVRHEWCVRSAESGDKTSLRVISTDAVFTPSEEQLGKSLLLRVSPSSDSDLWTQVDLPPVLSALPSADRWRHTKQPVEAPVFRTVTYNVLHDEFCSTGSAKRRIYPFATDAVLALEYRQVRIVQELLAYNADLICLQECGKKVYHQYFERVLRHHGYEGRYTNKSGGVREGCASFWRSSRFCLQNLHEFSLNWATLQQDHPELAAQVADHAELQEALENITSIGTVLVLKDLHTREDLLVGNTHLFYHANACHIRMLQTYMLLYKLKLLSKSQCPVVLCGDFNFTHTTGGYKLATTGRAEATHHSWNKGELFYWGCDRMLGVDAEEEVNEDVGSVAAAAETKTITTTATSTPPPPSIQAGHQPPFKAFKHDLLAPLQLADAYGLTDPDMPWTNYTMTFREVIDYVFFAPARLLVVRTIPIPPESELAEDVALPNKRYPSDHVALIVDLSYQPLPS
ncbi:2,5-phosphodiesterase [Trypanosoma grayi]|uniref:2,5-phosphodiesterase n=1 Tax=Trypanosoma grayi TaxID=71804 RepID=UPI0004F4B6AC|nr:2,5-phosphodiesterase [Trypanosoma grayi]KEG11291.1 2,5-phosphodiesterase [Trypanosoma grayi]